MVRRVTGYGRGAAAIELAPIPQSDAILPTSGINYDFGQLVYDRANGNWYIYTGGNNFIQISGTSVSFPITIPEGGTDSTSFAINGTVISGSTTTSPLTALTMTNGQLIIGSTSGSPAAAVLTPGVGISISNASNSITISATGAEFSIGAFNNTPDAQGLSLSGSSLSLNAASGSNPGGVSTGIQSFGGAKSFTTSISSPLVLVTGASSGTVTIQGQAAAGTYNFNLPTTAGTSGYFLTSAGGGSSPMTWTSVSASGAVTTIDGDSGSVTPTAGVITISGGSTGLTTAGSGSTLDLTGTLNLASGGTSASLSASNGGIFYSTASAGAILSGTATALRILQSGSMSAPSWSTSTYPATTVANEILYASATNVVGQITTVANGVLITNNSDVPSFLPNSVTPGYVLTSQSGAPPAWGPIPSSSFPFTDEATSFSALAENGYFITGAATATLPSSPSQGNTITFLVDTASSFVIQAAAGQSIRIGSSISSVAGTATNNAIGNGVTLVYRASDLTWIASEVNGVWTTA